MDSNNTKYQQYGGNYNTMDGIDTKYQQYGGNYNTMDGIRTKYQQYGGNYNTMNSMDTKYSMPKSSVFWEHILPGSFFTLVGVCFMVQIWRHYLISLIKRGQPFRSQFSYSTQCRRCSVDLFALMACVAGILGSTTQLTHLNVYGRVDITTAHHVTMYCFFGMAGVFRLLHPVLKRRIPQLDEMEYIVLILAFVIQAMLFNFHLIGRDKVDTMLHTYLLYCVYGCIIMTFSEMIFRNQVLLSIGKSYFITLVGTWFCQLAFVLDSPFSGHMKLDPKNEDDLMLTTLMFSWHMGGVFLFSVFCGFGWVHVYRKKGELGDAELAIVEPVANGYTHLTN